jgi:hypothetical protein
MYRWLKDEPRDPEVKEGIEEIVVAINHGRANMITSVLTLE